jgi:cytochrome c oxidase subunit 3
MHEANIHTEEHRDDAGAKLGMWIFIFTELLLFGGLFVVYAVFRNKYSEEFHISAHQLNTFVGTANTLILLISSMTIAMSISALQKGNKSLALKFIYFTLFCALVFLVNKYFEWGHKIHIDLYPGTDLMVSLMHGEVLFFSLYYFMTGLHALHIIVGMVILGIVAVKVKSGKVNADRYVFLENGALYWHLVDLIWIFLFPLFYLIT